MKRRKGYRRPLTEEDFNLEPHRLTEQQNSDFLDALWIEYYHFGMRTGEMNHDTEETKFICEPIRAFAAV